MKKIVLEKIGTVILTVVLWIMIQVFLSGVLCSGAVPPYVPNSMSTNREVAITNILITEAWRTALRSEPQNQNLDLRNLANRTRQGKILRICSIGDQAYDAYTYAPGMLANYLTWVGTIGGSGGRYYGDLSANVTQVTMGFGMGVYIYGMPDASTITTRNTFNADTITCQYYKASGFGTFQVQTQINGGTWTTVKTIDSSAGSGFYLNKSNFSTTLSPYKVRILASGTNAVHYAGNYEDTGSTNFLWDTYQAGSQDLTLYATNALYASAVTNLFSQYDLVIASASDQTNQAQIGYTSFRNILRAVSPTTDFLVLQPPLTTNALPSSVAYRRSYGVLGSDWNMGVLDNTAGLWGLTTAQLTPFYGADGVHLSALGNTIASAPLVNAIVNPFAASTVWKGTIAAEDGTTSVPAIGWASDNDDTGTGFYRNSPNRIAVTINGNYGGQFQGAGIWEAAGYFSGQHRGTVYLSVGADIGIERQSAGVAKFVDGSGNVNGSLIAFNGTFIGKLSATNRVEIVDITQVQPDSAICTRPALSGGGPSWISNLGHLQVASGSGGGFFVIPIPAYLTNGLVTFYVGCAANNQHAAWTNVARLDWDVGVDSYRPATSGPSIEFYTYASNQIVRAVSIPITNVASGSSIRKGLTISVNAATNTSTRYFMGPVTIVDLTP